MKTAISISDDLFLAAEGHAKRIGFSRSQLYATALAEYLKSQRHCGVREALDRVYGLRQSGVDPLMDSMQRASINPEDW